jgi:hypothetical protein
MSQSKFFTAEPLNLKNSVKNTKRIFYCLKIILFQILKKALKRAKTLKNQQKKTVFLFVFAFTWIDMISIIKNCLFDAKFFESKVIHLFSSSTL